MSDYSDRPAFVWFSDFLDDALRTAETHSVLVNGASELSDVESATATIAPSALSIATSIRLLVSEGFTPSARILVRPLLERTATLDFLVNEENAIDLWNDGWKNEKKRPSLGTLLSRLDFERTSPKMLQQFIIDDLNAVVHVDPRGLDSLKSPTNDGRDVHWFENHPSDFSNADNICHASAMCAVFLGSNIRRAFHDRLLNWQTKHPSPRT